MKNNNENFGSITSNNLEIRNFISELRAIEENSRLIRGLAIPVGSRSDLLYGEFYETIEPTALEDVIDRFDVKLYLNHDPSQGTYGRSKFGKGSLRLFLTDRGLEFETEAPNTAFGDALLEGIRRGDFDAMSFAFAPDDEQWVNNGDGTYNRTIKHIGLLDEISILSVTPAYSATEVACRSLENFKEEQRKAEEAKKQQILDSLDAKMKSFEESAKI